MQKLLDHIHRGFKEVKMSIETVMNSSKTYDLSDWVIFLRVSKMFSAFKNTFVFYPSLSLI